MQSCKIRYSSVKVRKILTFTISLTNLYKIYKTFRHIPAILIPSKLQRKKKFYVLLQKYRSDYAEADEHHRRIIFDEFTIFYKKHAGA